MKIEVVRRSSHAYRPQPYQKSLLSPATSLLSPATVYATPLLEKSAFLQPQYFFQENNATTHYQLKCHTSTRNLSRPDHTQLVKKMFTSCLWQCRLLHGSEYLCIRPNVFFKQVDPISLAQPNGENSLSINLSSCVCLQIKKKILIFIYFYIPVY